MKRNIPVDVFKNDEDFVVFADVPGVQKSAINLNVERTTVTISVPGSAPNIAALDALAVSGRNVVDKPEIPDNVTSAKNATAMGTAEEACSVKVLQRERAQQFKQRVLKFPETASLAEAKAECKGGVLRVSIPKKALPQPCTISIA
eukprot:jgi/Ulvmu1/123/UM001_0127.1